MCGCSFSLQRDCFLTGLVQSQPLSPVQGPDCLLHEGRPVGRGCEKWLLRSDVLAAEAPAEEAEEPEEGGAE